ncbi:HAD-superfamily hydrolase, subfamily IA, variant 2 (HAD-like) [Paraburkholderia ribeironis]|uniref:HAD-superfamily hydrolase, subfamily IA, variant 2 (HAD-like) n=1 Tax=Paraburkholderia ribeironis TaxID=1247936 RepID=A0A1N7SNN6_9BURK|nr:HAD-IA family hydrolase [Paraburkholderia ribeironis]SIT48541.1 HAD-superfamily hydrolase, subfamily IA, variant 2 (HAD-like) [Paraburkholderia ribeironis]
MTSASVPAAFPRAVLFDLLTALLDSWTSWNHAAGSEQAGRAWRAAYLRLTYGCGQYIAYEQLVRDAAAEVGLPESAVRSLEADWLNLTPWRGALDALRALEPHCKLAVVTNCSTRLGTQAARLFPIRWDAIVTAEEAGVYKPNARPYRLALEKLGVQANEAAFVAGSSYDMFGTAAVGLRTYWHNHVGLPLVAGAPPPEFEAPTLDSLLPWLGRFGLRPQTI